MSFGDYSLANIDPNDGPGLHIDTGGMLPIDAAEAAAAEPYNPNPSNGNTWWQNALQYGFGRFVDNGFSSTPRIGDFYAGGGAGYGGQTYFNRAGQRGSVPIQQAGFGIGGVSPLLLIAGAAVLFLALRGK